MSPILEGLNDQQREAVLQTEGPLLIIAGAGSGKTKALTHRIAYLIKDLGVSPEHILAVTFTNKAAHEMKERVEQLLEGLDGTLPLVGTFHSICVRILRKTIHNIGYENAFSIYDTADQLALMKSIFKQRHISDKQFNPKAVLGAISNAKNELIPHQEYTGDGAFGKLVQELYPIYQRALHSAGALDFDDIIMKMVELFQQHPQILERYQEQFQYICVDEYQDTNQAQYTLVQMLAEKYKNLCVIGDDWQSIYSWRGANIQNILNFERDYPGAKVIKLEQNYRSTKTIVEAANAVVKQNERRTDKELWSAKESEEKITVIEGYNERDEVEKIIEKILGHMRDLGKRYKDFVLLYRTNAQSRVLEEGMMRHGIPYKIVGGVKFYERKEVKDMLAYLRLIMNPRDNVSFARIVNVPSRKIGAKSLQVLQEAALKDGLSMYEVIPSAVEQPGLTPGAKTALSRFYMLIEELRSANKEFAASGVMKHVIKMTGYDKYLLDGTNEGEERFANVEELISVASKYDGLEAGLSLATFLEEVALVSEVDQLSETDDSVTLMTLHASKGLEYDYVFITGMEDGLFPSSRSQMDPKDLEEERRLMYVGMTRAKEKLYLTRAQNRLLYGSFTQAMPSRFLDEVPDEHMEGHAERTRFANLVDSAFEEDEVRYVEENMYDVGDTVEHQSWGPGTILKVEGDILTVKFQNARFGTKKIAANIAPIRRV